MKKFERLLFLMEVVVRENVQDQIDLSLLDDLIEECEYQLGRSDIDVELISNESEV